MKIKVFMTSEYALVCELEGKGRNWFRGKYDVHEGVIPRSGLWGELEVKEFYMEDDFPFCTVRKALFQYSRIQDVAWNFLFAMDSRLSVGFRMGAIEQLSESLRDKRILKAIRRNEVLKIMARKYMRNIPTEWFTPVLWKLFHAWGLHK